MPGHPTSLGQCSTLRFQPQVVPKRRFKVTLKLSVDDLFRVKKQRQPGNMERRELEMESIRLFRRVCSSSPVISYRVSNSSMVGPVNNIISAVERIRFVVKGRVSLQLQPKKVESRRGSLDFEFLNSGHSAWKVPRNDVIRRKWPGGCCVRPTEEGGAPV